MKRGDVILIREPNTPAGKARPYVVIQRSSTLDASAKVTGCPLTSQLRGAEGQRPLVVPTNENGLRGPSEVQVDWIYTHRLARVDRIIGQLDDATMRQVDDALRRWLAL